MGNTMMVVQSPLPLKFLFSNQASAKPRSYENLRKPLPGSVD